MHNNFARHAHLNLLLALKITTYDINVHVHWGGLAKIPQWKIFTKLLIILLTLKLMNTLLLNNRFNYQINFILYLLSKLLLK